MAFTETDLESRGRGALLRGEPVRIDLEPGRWRGSARTARPVARPNWVADLDRCACGGGCIPEGKSLWQAVLAVPIGRRDRRNEASPFTLTLNSDLRGMAIRLPGPSANRPARLAPSP